MKTMINLKRKWLIYSAFVPIITWMFVCLVMTIEGHSADKTASSDLTIIKERWGMDIQSIRPAAAGRMLNFRYKVIDPMKVASFMGQKTKAHIINQATNKKLIVSSMPKIGTFKGDNHMLTKGKTYTFLFSNPGGIKSGDMVTVLIGDFIVEDLVVE